MKTADQMKLFIYLLFTVLKWLVCANIKANKTKVAKKQMKMNLRMHVELYEQLLSKRMWKREREGKLCQGHKIRARSTILETNLESH